MKNFAAVSALFLSAVSAAPMQQRDVTKYEITNFSASSTATESTSGAYLKFDIEIPGVLISSCTYTDETSGTDLPFISYTACDDPSVEWQFRQIQATQTSSNGPYLLVVTYEDSDGNKVGGSRTWNSDEFPEENNDGVLNQVYTGESDFVITL